MPLQVYRATEMGEPLNTARLDMVGLLKDFKQDLLESNILPNITDAIDNHQATGLAQPYASVGITGAQFQYLSRSASAYEINLTIDLEVWLHFNKMDSQYDERAKWSLVQSLFNFLKNRATISARFDQFLLRDVTGTMNFMFTQTQGAVLRITVQKVAAV